MPWLNRPGELRVYSSEAAHVDVAVNGELGNQCLGAKSMCSDRKTRADAVGPAG